MTIAGSSPLRVAIVCPVVSATRGGGMERAVHTVVSALQERCNLTVIASRLEGLKAPDRVTWVRLPSIPVHHFLVEYFTFRRSWRQYRRRRPLADLYDVTYSVSPLFEGTDFAAVHFSSTRYLKVIPKPAGAQATAKAILKYGYHRAVHGISSRRERRLLGAIGAGRSPAFLLPVSQELGDSLREDFDLPASCMQIVPNPLDLDRFSPGREEQLRSEVCRLAGWSTDDFLLLFVGGGWHRKGLRAAMEALARTPPGVKLVVAGAGDVAAYRRFADSLGIAHRVWFAGVRSDVERFYRIAAALVLPSVFEALPLSCTEALASGVPVIVYPFPGSATLVENGVNGFIVDSPDGVASAIETLRTNPALLGRMFGATRRSVQRFAPPAIADCLMELFEARAERRPR